MNAPLASPTAETFSLKRRSDSGGTPAMNYWGCSSEYGVLTDVLLGKADHIKHLSTIVPVAQVSAREPVQHRGGEEAACRADQRPMSISA